MTLEQIIEQQNERIRKLEEQMAKMMAHTHKYHDPNTWMHDGDTSEPRFGDEEDQIFIQRKILYKIILTKLN